MKQRVVLLGRTGQWMLSIDPEMIKVLNRGGDYTSDFDNKILFGEVEKHLIERLSHDDKSLCVTSPTIVMQIFSQSINQFKGDLNENIKFLCDPEPKSVLQSET